MFATSMSTQNFLML